MDNNLVPEKIQPVFDNKIQFSKINLDEDYSKKWNNNNNDFICLTKNGELLRPTLYRIGGIGPSKPNEDGYYVLLKYVEAFYSDEIMSMSAEHYKKHNIKNIKHTANHLEAKWVIIDKFGNEKIELDNFNSPHLVKNSCIYSIKGKYYNIETNELYCYTNETCESSEFLFLENRYNFGDCKDKPLGVYKINKKDGSFEIFK